MKKIIALALTVLIALSCLTACGKAPASAEAGKEIKVGICNYVDDASLNQIVDNIQSRLKEIGEENGVTFNVSYDNWQRRRQPYEPDNIQLHRRRR